MPKDIYNNLEDIFDFFSNNQKETTFVDDIKQKNSDINVNHYISKDGFNIYKYKDENGINNTIISKKAIKNIFSNEKNKSNIETYFLKKEYKDGFNTISCIIGDNGDNNVANIEYDSRTSWNNTFFVPPFGVQKGIDKSPSYLFEKAIDYIGKNDNYKKSLYEDALNTYKDMLNKTNNNTKNTNNDEDSYVSIIADEFLDELNEENLIDKETRICEELNDKSMDELIEIYNELKSKIEKNKSYLRSLKYNV